MATDFACASKPSLLAKVSIELTTLAKLFLVASMYEVLLKKSNTDSPDSNLAFPDVGNT